MADEFDPYSKGVEYQVTKVDPTDPETKGAVYQVHKVDEVTAAMSGKFYRARVIKDPDEPTVKGKVYQIVIIDDPDDPSVKGKVYNAIITGDQEAVVVGPAVPPLDLDSAVADTLTYVKAYGGLLQSNVPLEYTQVDYAIKKGAAGVQGKFDTGIRPTVDDVKIEIKVKIGDEVQASGQLTVGSFYACQARATASADITGISGSSASGSIIGMQNGQSVASGIVRVKDHIDITRYEYKNGNHSIYVKDLTTNTEDTQTGTYTFGEPTKNLYIFGNTTTTNNLNNNNALYYCKIWVSGSLAFDAVPVIRNSDNKVGLYDKVSERFIEPIISSSGGFVAGDATVPTPSDPMDLYCNNGVLKVLDKSQWTIFTNPSSIAGQGVWIDTTGMWKAVDDNGAGCAIPLTIGKQYTLVIHKKTASLGTLLRYGQSPQDTPTAAGVQLTDWYRGEIADGQIISFVAKQAYFVMQLSPAAVEAGMIQEAIEVLEASSDYTFVDFIKSDGSAYIDTGISPTANTVAEVVCKCDSGAANRNIFGSGISTSTGASKQAVFVMSSYNNNEFESKVFETTADFAFVRFNGDITQKNTLSISGNGDIKLNGVVMATQTASPLPNNKPIWLFARWRPTPSAINGTVAIYGFKVWENGALVQDLMPAIRNSDNVVGMYDTVSGTFFENQGTGTFTAGTVIGSGEVLKLTPSNDTAGVTNLLKINDYVDTQEILTGLINHQLGIVVLDGTEDWAVYGTPNPYFRAEFGTGITKSTSTEGGMSTHFAVVGIGASTTNQGMSMWVYNGKDTVGIRYNDLYPATSANLASFKSWLAAQYAAGTPVMMVFPLLTAQDEVAPVPQTMQVVEGDNVLDIVQAGMSGLEVEAGYTKEG